MRNTHVAQVENLKCVNCYTLRKETGSI